MLKKLIRKNDQAISNGLKERMENAQKEQFQRSGICRCCHRGRIFPDCRQNP